MRRRVVTVRGTAWIEDHDLDIYWVYATKDALQMIGSIVVVGREIDEVVYTWSVVGDDAPNGTAASEEAAVVAIIAANGESA